MKYCRIIFFATISLLSCKNETINSTMESNGADLSVNEIAKASKVMLEKSEAISNWLQSFDFDGDNVNDTINFDYNTGGAHCCYKIAIKLSSQKTTNHFPFEMDGGYVLGVDNSKPEQFNIGDIDKDGLPEITMLIQTYNDKTLLIAKEWRKKYGIKTNRIIIEFNGKELIVKDNNLNLKK
jgi:hypothetical protein